MNAVIHLQAQRARRDWVQLTLWILGTALLAYASYAGVEGSYGDQTSRASLVMTVLANPVIMLFRGLPSGIADGAFILFLILPFLAMMAAFMSTFLAVRHTRADEESGRAELLAASGAGRVAPIWATILHGLAANLILGVLTAVTFLAVGLPASGSWVSGLATAAVGVCFLGIGLICAQVMPTSRGANSLTVWLVMATYLLAGIGNALGSPDYTALRVESSWVTWLSPFGWAENSRPFADNAVWPLVLCLSFGLALSAVGVWMQSTRDLGASLLPQRRGRDAARPSLRTPTALAWRLNRGAIIGWGIGGLLTGLMATSLASVLQDAASQNSTVQQLLQTMTSQSDMAQAAVAVFFTMLGILGSAAAVQVVTRARQEEARGTAELVLTAPVDRVRWLAGYLVVALLAIVGITALAVAGAAGGLAITTHSDWSLMRNVLVVGAGQLLASTVFLALVSAVFVVAPRLTIPLGWLAVLTGAVLGLWGPLFGFPSWLIDIAPIASAPTMTGDTVDLKGGVWLLLVALAAACSALTLMRRRELAIPG